MLALEIGNGRVMLVDEATGEVKWSAEAQSARGLWTECVAMEPSGRFLATVGGGDDENWKLWDVASGTMHTVGAKHDGTGACICKVDLLGLRVRLQAGCPVQAHSAGIRTMAFSPCGQRLATAGDDCAVILWEAQTGKLEHRMQGHTQTVTSLAYSPDGARLASGGVDRSIRVWDPTTGALLRSIPEKCEELGIAVHFSPTEPRRLASVASDMLLAGRQWDVDSGEMIKCVEDYEFSFLGRDFVEFSPDGSTIATASTTRAGDIHLLDAESGTLRLKIVGHHDYVIPEP